MEMEMEGHDNIEVIDLTKRAAAVADFRNNRTRVGYKCRCTQGTQWIFIAARSKEEGVGQWVDRVVLPACSKHHEEYYGSCLNTRIELVVPPGADGKPGTGTE